MNDTNIYQEIFLWFATIAIVLLGLAFGVILAFHDKFDDGPNDKKAP